MHEISIILTTARNDFSILGLPETHILGPCIESLSNQTFKDFELIVVDSLIDLRPKMFKGEPFNGDKLPFDVKHVPVHPNHRFWLDRKMWNFNGALNTALIHAEGELIMKLDDCCQFKEDLFQRIWEEYNSGYFPLVLHTRYRGGHQAYYNKEYRSGGYEFTRTPGHGQEKDLEKALSRVFDEGDPVRCSRWPYVEKAGGRMCGAAIPHNWFYGYSSFTLEAALTVNGYDENMDPDKSIEDVDLGSRFQMAGYKDMFLLDTDLWVIEHEHSTISKHAITYTGKPCKCNYALYLLNLKNKRWRVNSDKLNEKDLAFIREESRRPPCSPTPDFYAGDMEAELFNTWISRQPIFDLREERFDL